MQRATAILRYGLRHVFINDKRPAGAQDVSAESGVVEWRGRNSDPLAPPRQVGVVNQASLSVHDADAHVGLMEDLANLVADRIVDTLHVEFGRQRLLHAGDD